MHLFETRYGIAQKTNPCGCRPKVTTIICAMDLDHSIFSTKKRHVLNLFNQFSVPLWKLWWWSLSSSSSIRPHRNTYHHNNYESGPFSIITSFKFEQSCRRHRRKWPSLSSFANCSILYQLLALNSTSKCLVSKDLSWLIVTIFVYLYLSTFLF